MKIDEQYGPSERSLPPIHMFGLFVHFPENSDEFEIATFRIFPEVL